MYTVENCLKGIIMKTVEGTFKSFDNAALLYREWKHEAEPNGRILIILHRGHEHSGRLESIAAKPEFAGYKVFSYDNRGHGYTQAEASYEFMDFVRDLDAFVSFVCEKEGKQQEDIFIIANSVAGVTASTWVHDYAPKVRGVALIAPAFKIKLYFPLAKTFLKLAIKLKPKLNIKSYVKSKFLTHDEAEQKRYDEDTRITPHIPARQLTTLLDTAHRVVEDAETIVTPMLVLSATKDYVVESGVQGNFYAKLSSSLKRFVKLEGFYHGVLYESEHQKAISEIASFMEKCYSHEAYQLLEEVIRVTQKEKDIIAFGTLPVWKEASYFIQRFMMKNLGFMSDGMKIGKKYGFDSGVTLDYVYKNEPSGVTWLGKMIDKNYLQSIGWKGIRKRKVNMIAETKAKIALLQEKGEQVRILDIAGGPARYLIEIAEVYPEVEVQVRDYQAQNVEEGRTLAKERNLSNITYVQSDAFDVDNYDPQGYRPNIVIISGVFELFEDNDLIGVAIDGVASIIEEGGYLLYTGQPWHPQLEQIANVLGNHRQEKWIMRRRSQYELDYLFGLRNFEKDSMQIDDWGIFTVSSAQYKGKN